MAKKKAKAAKAAKAKTAKAKPAPKAKASAKAKAKAGAKSKGTRSAVQSVKKAVAKAAKKVKRAVQKLTEKAMPAQAAPTVGSVVHIEFHTPDLEAAKTFWSELAGWQFHPFQPTELYFHSPGNWGPGGCVIQGAPNMTGSPAIYVQVDEIPAALEKAKSLGATVVKERTEIAGGHGFYGHFRTPDGNVFAFWSRS